MKLHGEGKLDEAIQARRQVLALAERVLGPSHAEVAGCLDGLVTLLTERGDLEEAGRLFDRALEIRRRGVASVTMTRRGCCSFAATRSSLAGQATRRFATPSARSRSWSVHSRPSTPLSAHRSAASTACTSFSSSTRGPSRTSSVHSPRRRSSVGPEDPYIAELRTYLAGTFDKLGQLKQARVHNERALAIWEKALGPAHPRVAAGLSNLALILMKLGAFEQSKAMYERAIRIDENALGPDHPKLGGDLTNYGVLVKTMGDYERSKALHERALAIMEKAHGSDHAAVSVVINNLAEVLEMLGQYKQARVLYQRTVAIQEKLVGPNHPLVATPLNNLAGAYMRLGEFEQALPLHMRAHDIRKKSLGPDHPDVAQSLHNLGYLLEVLGQSTKAMECLTVRSPSMRAGWAERTLSCLSVSARWAGCCSGAVAMRRHGPCWSDRFRSWRPPSARRPPHWLSSCIGWRRCTRGSNNPSAQRRCLRERCALRSCRSEVIWRVCSRRSDSASCKPSAGTSPPGCAWRPGSGNRDYEEVLRLKGMLARAMTAERRLARAADDELAPRMAELQESAGHLARLANSPPSFRDERKLATWRAAYAKTGAEHEALALALQRDYTPLREGLERLDLGLAEVRKQLGADDALIDIIQTRVGYIRA